MIQYLENPKDATRKLLEHINEFGKVAGYKINTQKSTACLYNNNEISARAIREIIPFTIASKRINYLGINLPKETKGLYCVNYKILMKAINDTNRWKDTYLALGLEESLFPMTVLTQGSLESQCSAYQITNGIYHRTRTKQLKVCLETEKTRNSQSHPEKEKWSWRNQAP